MQSVNSKLEETQNKVWKMHREVCLDAARSIVSIALEAAALSPEEAEQIGVDQTVTADTLKNYKKYGGEFMSFFRIVNEERRKTGGEQIFLETHFANAILFYARVHMGNNPAKSTVRGRKAGVELHLETYVRGNEKFWKTNPVWRRMWNAIGYRRKSDKFSSYQIIDAGLKRMDLDNLDSVEKEALQLQAEGEGEDPEDHLPDEVQSLRRGAATEEMLIFLFSSIYFKEACIKYGVDPDFIEMTIRAIFECALRRCEFFALVVGGHVESTHTLHVNCNKRANANNNCPNIQQLPVLDSTHHLLCKLQKGRPSGEPLFTKQKAPYAVLNMIISGAAPAGVSLWNPLLKYTLHSLRHGGLQWLWAMTVGRGRLLTEKQFYKLGHTSPQCAHKVYLIPNEMRLPTKEQIAERAALKKLVDPSWSPAPRRPKEDDLFNDMLKANPTARVSPSRDPVFDDMVSVSPTVKVSPSRDPFFDDMVPQKVQSEGSNDRCSGTQKASPAIKTLRTPDPMFVEVMPPAVTTGGSVAGTEKDPLFHEMTRMNEGRGKRTRDTQ